MGWNKVINAGSTASSLTIASLACQSATISSLVAPTISVVTFTASIGTITSLVCQSAVISAGTFNSIDLGKAYSSSFVCLSATISAADIITATIQSLSITSNINVVNRVGVANVAPDAHFTIGRNLDATLLNAEFRIGVNSAQEYGVIRMGQSAIHHGLLVWYASAAATVAFFCLETYSGKNYLVLQPHPDGKVGLGEQTPVEKLQVTGTVRASTGFNYNGTAGISVVLTLSAGTICTFLGGILVSAVT